MGPPAPVEDSKIKIRDLPLDGAAGKRIIRIIDSSVFAVAWLIIAKLTFADMAGARQWLSGLSDVGCWLRDMDRFADFFSGQNSPLSFP